MSIESNLESIAQSLAILAKAYGGGTTAQVDAAAEAVVETKKKRGRPAAEPVVEEKPAARFLDDDDEEEETAAPVLTRDDVKKSLMAAQERLTAKYADAQKGLNEAMAVLKDNGNVERIGQLGDDQKVFKKIIDAANAKAPKK